MQGIRTFIICVTQRFKLAVSDKPRGAGQGGLEERGLHCMLLCHKYKTMFYSRLKLSQYKIICTQMDQTIFTLPVFCADSLMYVMKVLT